MDLAKETPEDPSRQGDWECYGEFLTMHCAQDCRSLRNESQRLRHLLHHLVGGDKGAVSNCYSDTVLYPSVNMLNSSDKSGPRPNLC